MSNTCYDCINNLAYTWKGGRFDNNCRNFKGFTHIKSKGLSNNRFTRRQKKPLKDSDNRYILSQDVVNAIHQYYINNTNKDKQDKTRQATIN